MPTATIATRSRPLPRWYAELAIENLETLSVNVFDLSTANVRRR